MFVGGAWWAYAQSQATVALTASNKKVRDRRQAVRPEAVAEPAAAGKAHARGFGRR